MKNALVLARKDAASYFHTWLGVFIFAFFYLITGIFISLLVTGYARLSVTVSGGEAVVADGGGYQAFAGLNLTRFVFGSFFLNMSVLLIFLVPLVSMRAFAEERRQETLELLFTYPFSDFDIVWGKFLGLVWIFELLFLPTAAYLLLVRWLGGHFDWGPVLTSYLGFWLLGNAFLSLGLFISSLTVNQVVSAVVTFGCLILFWILDWVAGLTDGTLARFLMVLSPLSHYREFTMGILDLQHIVYFCFFHFYFLFLTLRSIETRNWKG
jgi:ABC-2 type transport system permease protein